jgi:hypothetical protein
MRRREFVAGLSAAAWPLMARAQQGLRRVGVLMNVVKDDPGGVADMTAFRKGLAELGWDEGRNIQIESRWPGGDIERVEALAKELVGLRPDVLLARSTPTTAALKGETGSIPIVFVGVAEPIESGFVQNLARPGGQHHRLHQFRRLDRGQMAAATQGGRSADRAGRGHLQSADGAFRRIVSAFSAIGGADAFCSNR